MNNGKIDLNTILGFVLIGAIFIYFGYFQNDDVAENAGDLGPADTVQVEESSDLVTQQEMSELDTTEYSLATDTVPEEFFTLENELLSVSISSKGGQIKKAELRQFLTYDSLPLFLINDNVVFNIPLMNGTEINTAELNFQGIKEGNNKLKLVASLGGNKRLEFLFRLEDDSYMVDWDVKSYGLGNMITSQSGLQWEMVSLRHEKNRENENQYTQAEFLHQGDEIDDLSPTGEDDEEATNLKWLAIKQQFFSTILLNKQGTFPNAVLTSNTFDETQPGITKHFVSKMGVSQVGSDLSMPLGLYLGPNKYDLLKSYDQQFEELIPLGWGILGWINRGIVMNVFNWLQHYGLNYGIIILIMALLIKVILFPLTYQSYRSMAKMRVLKPEMDELNEKFKDQDAVKKQQAVMEMYKKAGVNPLGGCIPVVLQLPILIALFRFFPASIELRQQGFLWADDLSTYDSIAQLPFEIPFYGDHVSLFTLLMTVSTLIYTYMNNQLQGTNQQFPQMKYMMYFMPFIFLGVFNNYASGLSYYYFVANVITFGQQFLIRRTLNDDKIHALIKAKREKPNKENRLMRRMKDMQEDQNRSSRRKKK